MSSVRATVNLSARGETTAKENIVELSTASLTWSAAIGGDCKWLIDSEHPGVYVGGCTRESYERHEAGPHPPTYTHPEQNRRYSR